MKIITCILFTLLSQQREGGLSLTLTQGEHSQVERAMRLSSEAQAEWNNAVAKALDAPFTESGALAALGMMKTAYLNWKLLQVEETRIKEKIKALRGCLDCEFSEDFKFLLRPATPATDQKKGQKADSKEGEKGPSKQ